MAELYSLVCRPHLLYPFMCQWTSQGLSNKTTNFIHEGPVVLTWSPPKAPPPFFILSHWGLDFTTGIWGAHIQSIINAFPEMSPYCWEGKRVQICRAEQSYQWFLNIWAYVTNPIPLCYLCATTCSSNLISCVFPDYFQSFLIVPAAGNLLLKAYGVHPSSTGLTMPWCLRGLSRDQKVPSHDIYSEYIRAEAEIL